MVSEDFVIRKVHHLLLQCAKAEGELLPPIDPAKIAAHCSVLSVEHRLMIPEGVLTPVSGGFKIYLQSNFAEHLRIKRRSRFTLAHELVHTFFYDLKDGVPKPLKGSPKGPRLEFLCHVGASRILVPDALLRQELAKKGEVASVLSILDLARLFDVSVEVVMRRLHELALTDEKFAAILVDTADQGRHVIQAACYGSSLPCNAAPPTRGMDFAVWVSPLIGTANSNEASEWEHTTKTATVIAKKVFRSKRSFLLDLRFNPPPNDRL